jgi:hypothetical protein
LNAVPIHTSLAHPGPRRWPGRRKRLHGRHHADGSSRLTPSPPLDTVLGFRSSLWTTLRRSFSRSS